ncbi:MAG: small ribosomal subunit Rsm22 family protein [Pseudomonadota bacterium]
MWEELERALISFIYRDSWGQTWKGESIPPQLYKSFAAHSRRISDGFTLDRKEIDLNYFTTKEGRAAYLLYFHLASVARTLAVLEECQRRGLWMNRPVRVLDLGCGTAPSLWALALAQQRFGGSITEAAALDGEKRILPVAAKIWQWSPKLRTVHAYFLDPRTPGTLQRQGAFDLVFASNVLNEMSLKIGDEQRVEFFDRILRENVAPEGMIIFIDPALQKTARDLTAFRDQWMKKGSIRTPIPCDHGGVCPLNAEPRDWCHFDVKWSPPPIRRRLERTLGHHSGLLKYSYLVVQKGNGPPRADRYRVLSDPLETKNGNLLIVCAPDRKIAIRFDRKKDGERGVLNSTRRGDLLELKFAEEPKRGSAYALETKAENLTSARKV